MSSTSEPLFKKLLHRHEYHFSIDELPPQVAAYEFTTLTCVPGVIRYRGAKIQLLDLPGIIEGAKDGKGRGRQVIATARTCNLILIVLDCLKPITHKKLIEHELEGVMIVSLGYLVPYKMVLGQLDVSPKQTVFVVLHAQDLDCD